MERLLDWLLRQPHIDDASQGYTWSVLIPQWQTEQIVKAIEAQTKVIKDEIAFSLRGRG